MASVSLYTDKEGELQKFLSKFYNSNFSELKNNLIWVKEYQNPIELAEIIGIFADNYDDFFLKMLITIDKDVFINITSKNANNVIKYLFERFPY